MADGLVQEMGRLTDDDGRQLAVGVDHDAVVIGAPPAAVVFYLSSTEAEEFAQLFSAACWQAGRNSAQMAAAEPSAHDCREATFTGMAEQGHDCRDATFARGL